MDGSWSGPNSFYFRMLVDPFLPAGTPDGSARGGRGLVLFGLLALSALVFLVVLLVVGFFFYTRYSAIAEVPIEDGVPITINIIEPSPGFELASGVPLFVQVEAAGPDPFVALEIWADDTIVGVQSAPSSAGMAALSSQFAWMPPTPGIHNLRARAFSLDGSSEESDVVWFFVQNEYIDGEVFSPESEPDIVPVLAPVGGGEGDPPSAEAIAQLPLPSAPSGPPSGPAANTPIATASPWTPTLGGFLPWLIGQPPVPSTPELLGSVDGCNVTLQIHDTADDELGFRLYRTHLGEGGQPETTFTLAAHSDQGWLEVLDEIGQGTFYTYTVEAFNAAGVSGLSNPATVSVYAAGCPPPEAPPIVALTPVTLTLQQPAEMAYCYVSRGGEVWARFPKVGFVNPNEEGIFQLDGPGSDLYREVVDADDPPLANKMISWDCWGWAGGQLLQLAKFESAFDLGDIGTLQLVDNANAAQLALKYGPFTDPVKLSLENTSFLGYDDILTAVDPTATDPTLLAPRLHYSTNTNDCSNNLPGSVSPDLRIVLCHPGHAVDTLNPGDVSQHPHAYLYWDFDDPDNCGEPGNCVHPINTMFFPYSVADVGFHVYDLHASQTQPVKTLHDLGDRLYIAPLKGPCGRQRAFEVRSFVQIDQPVTYDSLSPYAVTLFYEPCLGSTPVNIEVTFTNVHLSNVDDNDIGSQDVEVYGYFGVSPTSDTNNGLKIGAWGQNHTQCLSSESILDPGELLDAEQALYACSREMRDGNNTLAAHPTCVTPTYASCQGATRSGEIKNIKISTEQGDDEILVSILLIDYDESTGDDTVCQGSVWMTKQPDENWSVINNKTWSMYQGDNGSAACTVFWTTEVINP